jgi:methylated-DNA-[protein]-cysteine S-methyltransferase
MIQPTHFAVMDSPFGRILLAANGRGLKHLNFQDGARPLAPGEDWREDAVPFSEAIAQLKAYFRGESTRFDLQLAPGGTPFQQRVWRLLQAVPYGSTASYAQLAEQIGNPKAVRAVGAANARNPLPILIPCHRVIGSDGALTGYGGGLNLKCRLLELERRTLQCALQSEWRAESLSDLL